MRKGLAQLSDRLVSHDDELTPKKINKKISYIKKGIPSTYIE